MKIVLALGESLEDIAAGSELIILLDHIVNLTD